MLPFEIGQDDLNLERSEQSSERARGADLGLGKNWPLIPPWQAGCWTSSRKNRKAAAEHLERLNKWEKTRKRGQRGGE